MSDAKLFLGNTVWFYALAGEVVVLDQLAKLVARFALADGRGLAVIPGFFDLKLSFNRGAAFGVLPDWAPLFVLIALAAVLAIVKLRQADRRGGLTFGLGLLMGGALGNLIDRLASPERGVTDFLSFHVTLRGRYYAWPTFNLADAAIVVGAAITFFYVLVLEKRGRDVES